MIDPRERDPRFPDRPTHPDFITLSEAVQRIDHEAEGLNIPLPQVVGVDLPSVLYLFEHRRGKFRERGAHAPFTDDEVTTLQLDAFTAGKRYAETVYERALADEAREDGDQK